MVSEQLQSVIQMLRNDTLSGHSNDFATQRRNLEKLGKQLPVPRDVKHKTVQANGVKCEWSTAPDVDRDRVLLYLHGGGYTTGSVRTHRSLVARISAAGRLPCLSVDYRLAPEHPHPAAIEDATAVYEWLLDQGVAPERIAIAGDSAGGGLVAATLVVLRDASRPLPAAAVMLSPWTDLEGSGASMLTKADVDPMIQKDTLLQMAEAYLSGLDPRTPLASPLHARLDGLPALLIQAGTAEMLLDDATRFAERARAAGVDVTLDIWDDMIHVFQAFAPLLPEGQQAIDRIGTFLLERLP